jgi:hypothetical protein
MRVSPVRIWVQPLVTVLTITVRAVFCTQQQNVLKEFGRTDRCAQCVSYELDETELVGDGDVNGWAVLRTCRQRLVDIVGKELFDHLFVGNRALVKIR